MFKTQAAANVGISVPSCICRAKCQDYVDLIKTQHRAIDQ